MAGQYKQLLARPIASGHNDARNPVLLGDGESPDTLNVDLDRGSVASAAGSIKFNNQTAPRPGLKVGGRTGATLPVMPSKSVPIIAEGYLPYSESQDVIGADYAADTITGGAPPEDRSFARQRGKSFDLQVSFRIPEDEKLYPSPTLGALTNTTTAIAANLDMKFGFDQALDEFFAIVQKGGDRLTPMSWALGVVNTGALFDTDVGGGLNIFGLSTATYAKRVSNYALCFMWLDAPCYGVARPMAARYKLTNGGSVTFDPAELVNLTTATGAYASFAYRAIIVPFFVEPGVDYHTALRLTLDTGTPGTTFDPATGTTTGTAWNGNGVIDWRCSSSFGTVSAFTSTNGAGSQVLRYKGPSDSLEYLCKYGVRYHGRDAMHVGLGFRYSPWASAGFVPFGIDSAPIENGGFAMTDLSVNGLPGTVYGERDNPEEEVSAFNAITLNYLLRVEYDNAVDASGTIFGISERGLCSQAGFAGHAWGNETTRWSALGPQGKNPWAPYHVPWAGLGTTLSGVGTAAFNAEALKSYRLVWGQDNAGFAAVGACGGMISIGSYVGTTFGAYTFGQHIIAEGGDQFIGTNPNGATALTAAAGRWIVLIRAFRWVQRKVVVSDLRVYSTPRTWDVVCDFSLTHEMDLARTGEPGLGSLRGHWALSDGGSDELEESVLGNSGFLAPLAAPRAKDGGIFLSGEGEALYVNLCENEDFRSQLRAAQSNSLNGPAIQITMRLPEAQYAMTQRVNDQVGGGGASSYWRGKFAPILAAWDFEEPDRASDVLAPDGITFSTNQHDHIGGNASRPQPLLEFGHNVFVENGIGAEPFAYPMGFSLRAPANLATDQRSVGLAVPGTGANGLHAWHRPAGANVSRWDKFAGWAGKEVVMQFGLQPTSTADTFTAYIAAWPKEFFNPATNDPASAEFAYFATSILVTRRQVERSVIVIGGAWNPKTSDFRDTGLWLSLGRAAHEQNARMIVKDVRVFVASPAGALPATTGAAVPSGTGKIVGENALPLGPLQAEDLVYPVASNGGSVNMVEDSRSITTVGSSIFSGALPASSSFAVLRTLFAVLGDKVRQLSLNTDSMEQQRTYWIGTATSSTLTLNRPLVGVTRKASAAVAFRVGAYTAFQDEETPQLTVGRGRGFDLSSVTTKDAQIGPPAFANLSPVGSPWRFRVFTTIPSGRARDLLPTWDRGVKCSTWNKIRGLHSLDTRLFAGAQGSLFEADDRWRAYGPTLALPKSLAFRARRAGNVVLPLQQDRVVFTDTSSLGLNNAWVLQGAGVWSAFWDAWVKVESLEGLQTIAWCGQPQSNPANPVSAAATAGGMQFWVRLADGYPELVIGSNDVSGGVAPARGWYVARGTRRIAKGEWVHIRWAAIGVDAATDSLGIPTLWVGGKRVSIVRNATGDTANAGSWLALGTIPWDTTYQIALGAAHDNQSLPQVTQQYLAMQNASAAPIAPSAMQGWIHSLDGDLSGVVIGRFSAAAVGFQYAEDFDPQAIDYNQATTLVRRRFAVLELTQSAYGVGHRCLDAAKTQWGTIWSHPLISLTHEMGSEEAAWSFANFEGSIYCANGGRVGIVDALDGRFRFAGIRAPQTIPKFEVVRTPLWEPNQFETAGNPDNAPISSVSSTALASTTSTPAVVEQVYHYRNPGTMVLRQAEDAAFSWDPNDFFAFKCYIRMHSVSGRISIFSRRSSVDNGTQFLEIRDGHLVFGWYDTKLKQEVFVKTSIPVIEPGYVYYIYARKWFPRGGLLTGAPALFTKTGSNWANSVHARDLINDRCYDALIWRRFPRAAATGYDWTGWDAKAYDEDTDATAGWGGAANYAYYTNGSSPRACVSATIADSEFLASDPVALGLTITGVVMYNQALAGGGFTGDATGRVQIVGAVTRFVLDHVGMLLQVHGGTLTGQVYRITEFISATTVKCSLLDGSAAAPFNALASGTDTISVGMGVSLVKSENYDLSKTPDRGTYPIELFGSALQSNPINGFAPFNGEAWGFAYVIAPGETGDPVGNVILRPDIFEDLTALNCPNPAGAASIVACACEVGTDVFGVNFAGANPPGVLPFGGLPAGELMVDAFDSLGVAADYAHTAVDTTTYRLILAAAKTAPFPAVNIAPSSTQPNLLRTLALDASSTSATALIWTLLNPVLTGTRVCRLLYYDPAHDVLSAAGEEFQVNVPIEDVNNPSSGAQLVFTNLPACPDRGRFSTLIYLSQPGQSSLFLRVEVDDPEPDSIGIEIDEINLAELDILDITAVGVPPNAKYLAISQNRLCLGNLEGQSDGVAYSLPFFPEIVPPGNVFPLNTGRSEITALAEFRGALVVFKRDALIPFQFDSDTGIPIQLKAGLGDGCESADSIAKLEDRLYFVGERGPCVLLGDLEPFYLGRPMQDFFKSTIEKGSLSRISGAINRRRSQYVFTVQSAGRARMDQRWALEFEHPSKGEDVERAEMASGHRASFNSGPSCTALGSVEPRGGGPALLVGGTDHGFIVWLDRSDTRMVMSGALQYAGLGDAHWGDRTFTWVLAGFLVGDLDDELEGHMGQMLRVFTTAEQERHVLFATLDGANNKVYLDGPLQEAAAWLGGLSLTGATVSLGAALFRWSSKAYDCDQVALEKLFYYLDVSRKPSAGTLYVDLFRDLAPTPIGTVTLDLASAFTATPIIQVVQQARVLRCLFRTQTPAVDVDLELLDVAIRYAETDPR